MVRLIFHTNKKLQKNDKDTVQVHVLCNQENYIRWQKEKLEFVSCVMMVKFYAFYPSIKGFAFNIYGLIKNYSIRPTSQVGT